MPEGRVFFPDEPILRITAPILEAQLVETRIINLLHYQTLVASKAARVVASTHMLVCMPQMTTRVTPCCLRCSSSGVSRKLLG